MEKKSLKTNPNIKISGATFCKRVQNKIEDLQPCLVRYDVSADIIKTFITFNAEIIHPVKDVLKVINDELEKELLGEGWDKFYIRQNKNFPYNYGSEWECISFNLYRLHALFSD